MIKDEYVTDQNDDSDMQKKAKCITGQHGLWAEETGFKNRVLRICDGNGMCDGQVEIAV